MIDPLGTEHVACRNRVNRRQPARRTFSNKPFAQSLKHIIRAQ
jgi:hypothetical protein